MHLTPSVVSDCGGKNDGCGNIGYGDGDCDFDNDCVDGLLCGESNCAQFRNGSGWPSDRSVSGLSGPVRSRVINV